jgi:hypothetical protein
MSIHKWDCRAVILIATLSLFASVSAPAAPAVITGKNLRVSVSTETNGREVVQIKDGDAWVDALDTGGSVLQSVGPGKAGNCVARSAIVRGPKIVVGGTCSNGTFSREIEPSPEADTILVTVHFWSTGLADAISVEDRMTFAPKPRRTDTPTEGPLDFVWSQDIKALKDELLPHWTFKSPAVIFQQGRVFAAIVPSLDSLTVTSLETQPVALDLDVTSGDRAWFSYGEVNTRPFGHSYFRRIDDQSLDSLSGPLTYQYWVLASPEPPRLGYRRISRFLWEKFGSPALKGSLDLQRNVKQPELFLFDDWRKEAWSHYADEKYWGFPCGGAQCGLLRSNRNPWGKGPPPKNDAWFDAWFQNLRTAYGWYAYAQRSNNFEMQAKAESVLNLALTSPQHNGVFPIIYLEDTKTWLPDDGWAGFADDYHTFCMSWTGYWLIRWAEDLIPARKAGILSFLRPYADFLVKVQQASGCIPSWFSERLQPRSEFRDFNAETAGSALFLAEFSEFAGEPKYLQAAIRAQAFIANQVIPRQRWYDFETFLSCARKPFDFYDRWTAQYPQNNLSTMQAAQALLKIYRLTKQAQYLEQGEQVVDYLLLTQQVWNHPLFSPKLVGGTTTQNTDAEWSDARQSYLAPLLLDYYQDTGRLDYLERAVAAARAGFATAPWENWGHMGHANAHGVLSSFHWGTGSQMAAVEMMAPILGDAFVNVARAHGVGFNACNVANVHVDGAVVSFDLVAEPSGRRLLVRFAGLDAHSAYKLIVNGREPVTANGAELASQGYWAQL